MPVRIRMIKNLSASLEGFDLKHLHVGGTYELGVLLASYLLTAGCAVLSDDRETSQSVPLSLT